MILVGTTLRRAGGVAAAVSGLGAVAAALLHAAVVEATRLWAARPGLAFDDLVLAGALGVLALVTVWLAVAVALTVTVETLRCTRGRLARLARLLTPRLCRTLVRGACGAAVLAAPTGTATALGAPAELPPARAQACAMQPGADDLVGLPMPDRPGGAAPTRGVADVEASPERVRVRPGDTLWAIAARHLPPGATDAEVAAAWPVWFRTNRARLGPDPHLIHPRTRLVVPERFRPDDKDR